jgi:hypothetical protein
VPSRFKIFELGMFFSVSLKLLSSSPFNFIFVKNLRQQEAYLTSFLAFIGNVNAERKSIDVTKDVYDFALCLSRVTLALPFVKYLTIFYIFKFINEKND